MIFFALANMGQRKCGVNLTMQHPLMQRDKKSLMKEV